MNKQTNGREIAQSLLRSQQRMAMERMFLSKNYEVGDEASSDEDTGPFSLSEKKRTETHHHGHSHYQASVSNIFMKEEENQDKKEEKDKKHEMDSEENIDEMKELDYGDQVLKVGDVIYLKIVKEEGEKAMQGDTEQFPIKEKSKVLFGDGISSNRVFCTKVSKVLASFKKALFIVETAKKCKYIKKYNDILKQKQEGVSLNQKTASRKRAEEETNENENELKNNLGQPVLFGQSIQLRHFYSNCIFTLSTSILARQMGCLQIGLEEEFTDSSNFVLIPANKSKSAGDIIRYHDIVFIESSKDLNYFVHASGPDGGQKADELEVNGSEVGSRWRVRRYMRYEETIKQEKGDSGALRQGDIIRIVNPSMGRVISVTRRNFHHNFTRKEVHSTSGTTRRFSSFKQKSSKIDEIKSEEVSLKWLQSSTWEHRISWETNGQSSFYSLFEFQRAQDPFNGELPLFEESFRFKNVMTGLFLGVDSNGVVGLFADGTDPRCFLNVTAKRMLSNKGIITLKDAVRLEFVNGIVEFSEDSSLKAFKKPTLQYRALFSFYRVSQLQAQTANRISSLFPSLIEFYSYFQNWGFKNDEKELNAKSNFDSKSGSASSSSSSSSSSQQKISIFPPEEQKEEFSSDQSPKSSPEPQTFTSHVQINSKSEQKSRVMEESKESDHEQSSDLEQEVKRKKSEYSIHSQVSEKRKMEEEANKSKPSLKSFESSSPKKAPHLNLQDISKINNLMESSPFNLKSNMQKESHRKKSSSSSSSSHNEREGKRNSSLNFMLAPGSSTRHRSMPPAPLSKLTLSPMLPQDGSDSLKKNPFQISEDYIEPSIRLAARRNSGSSFGKNRLVFDSFENVASEEKSLSDESQQLGEALENIFDFLSVQKNHSLPLKEVQSLLIEQDICDALLNLGNLIVVKVFSSLDMNKGNLEFLSEPDWVGLEKTPQFLALRVLKTNLYDIFGLVFLICLKNPESSQHILPNRFNELFFAASVLPPIRKILLETSSHCEMSTPEHFAIFQSTMRAVRPFKEDESFLRRQALAFKMLRNFSVYHKPLRPKRVLTKSVPSFPLDIHFRHEICFLSSSYDNIEGEPQKKPIAFRFSVEEDSRQDNGVLLNRIKSPEPLKKNLSSSRILNGKSAFFYWDDLLSNASLDENMMGILYVKYLCGYMYFLGILQILFNQAKAVSAVDLVNNQEEETMETLRKCIEWISRPASTEPETVLFDCKLRKALLFYVQTNSFLSPHSHVGPETTKSFRDVFFFGHSEELSSFKEVNLEFCGSKGLHRWCFYSSKDLSHFVEVIIASTISMLVSKSSACFYTNDSPEQTVYMMSGLLSFIVSYFEVLPVPNDFLPGLFELIQTVLLSFLGQEPRGLANSSYEEEDNDDQTVINEGEKPACRPRSLLSFREYQKLEMKYHCKNILIHVVSLVNIIRNKRVEEQTKALLYTFKDLADSKKYKMLMRNTGQKDKKEKKSKRKANSVFDDLSEKFDLVLEILKLGGSELKSELDPMVSGMSGSPNTSQFVVGGQKEKEEEVAHSNLLIEGNNEEKSLMRTIKNSIVSNLIMKGNEASGIEDSLVIPNSIDELMIKLLHALHRESLEGGLGKEFYSIGVAQNSLILSQTIESEVLDEITSNYSQKRELFKRLENVELIETSEISFLKEISGVETKQKAQVFLFHYKELESKKSRPREIEKSLNDSRKELEEGVGEMIQKLEIIKKDEIIFKKYQNVIRMSGFHKVLLDILDQVNLSLLAKTWRRFDGADGIGFSQRGPLDPNSPIFA